MLPAKTGVWRINWRSRQSQELGDLLHAVVWPRGPLGSDGPGQWLATLNPTSHGGNVTRLLTAVCARLGLLPVHIAPDFQRALSESTPMCIVADTNSVYQGSLYQALRLRHGKPTTVVVPDQVFMEMQRRREADNSTKATQVQDQIVTVARHSLPFMGARVLSRIRNELRYIVHQARPPEAMVRYFGSDAGNRAEDERLLAPDAAGPNFQRDRLILEVVRHVPSSLPPGVPVWFVTGDENLALQADSEGFRVGYCWPPAMPQRFAVSSPFIDHHTGRGHHVTWQSLLEELTWNVGGLTIQEAGKSIKTEYRLPSTRDLILSHHGSYGSSWRVGEHRETVWTPGTAATSAPDSNDDSSKAAPRKAPAAQSLVRFLLESAKNDGVEAESIYEPVRPYLTALSWTKISGSRYAATERGAALASEWAALTRNTVEAHAAWVEQAASDLLQLQPVDGLLKAVARRPGATAGELANLLSWSERDVQAQVRLLTAFAILARVDKHIWPTSSRTRPDVETAVSSALTRLAMSTGSGQEVVGTDRLYRELLEKDGISLIAFRVALWELHRKGVVAFGGSVPTIGRDGAVAIDLLIPGDSGEPIVDTVSLGAGDFLIPGESSQTIRLLEPRHEPS